MPVRARRGWLLPAAIAAAALAWPTASPAAGPTAVATDSDGIVYAGFASGAVSRYRAVDGAPLAGWQTQVEDVIGSMGPIVAMDVAPAAGVSNGGQVWVLDANRRVQEFSRAGEFIRGFRLGPCEDAEDPAPAAKGGIDVTDRAVYVAHPCAHRIERVALSDLPPAGAGTPPSESADVYWPHGIAAPSLQAGASRLTGPVRDPTAQPGDQAVRPDDAPADRGRRPDHPHGQPR